jgi:uncharacterized protein HemX
MADEKTTDDIKPASRPAARRGVMDIQRPRVQQPASAAPPAAPDAVEFEPTPLPAEAKPDPAPEPASQPAPATPEAVAPVAPTPPAVDQPAAPHDPHQQMLAAHASKKGAPVVVIVVAIIIALGMAGLTVFAFMKTKDSTKPSGDQSHQEMSSSDNSATKAATTADVDEASKAVDSAIASDEATNLPESDLSDQTLGL